MPEYRRYMGLDLGSKTIGVALSDLLGMTAQGHSVIRRTHLEDDLCQLHRIIEDNGVTAIILGLPKNMNNTLGPQGETTLAFAKILRERFDLEVILWDERLTSREAERRLIEGGARREQRRKIIDKVAAALILEGFLQSRPPVMLQDRVKPEQ